MSVPSQESEQSCVCGLGVPIVSLSTTLIFDFEISIVLKY